MRTWVLWTTAVLGSMGCHLGLGDVCDARTACPKGLVCSFPDGDVEALKGVCDYPPRGEGEPCSLATECDAALTCSNHFEPGARYGRCVPRRAPGEVCFQDRDCTTKCEGESGTALDGICTE